MKLIQEIQTHYCRSLSSPLQRRKKPITKYFKDSVEIPEKEFNELLTNEFIRKYERTLGGNVITFEKI